MRFFFFGLLRDADVLELVTGRPWTADRFTGARLADARLVRLRGETFPMLVAAPDVWVPGVLVAGTGRAITASATRRLELTRNPSPCHAAVGAIEGPLIIGAWNRSVSAS